MEESLAPRTPVPQNLGQSSESGNAQASSSNAGLFISSPSMFGSATHVTINDGQFIASQGTVTINIVNESRTPRTSDTIRNQPSAQNVAPSPNPPNPTGNRNRRRRRRSRPEANVIRPVQRSNEMYEQHLKLKGRGFPLWIPQPNIRLPIPYRAKGVCIGDVGVVTAFGGFDFLFNICRSRDDPINPQELPDNFAPIDLNPSDVREFREFSSGSHLASQSIRVAKSQTGEQTPVLTFESSASEGAILIMPDGAFHEELVNMTKFRDYIAVHATNWYKFVNGPRGREARNGDIFVAVGSDKSTSWGMATFANTSPAQFRLKFRPRQQSQHNAGTAYDLEHSGVAEVKVGPELGENEELGETLTCQLRNQCLFIRHFSVTLRETVWAETFPGAVSAINQEGSQPDNRGQYLRPPNPNTSSSSSNPARSVQGRRRSLGPSDSKMAEEEDKDDEEGSALIPDIPWSSAPAKESAPSLPTPTPVVTTPHTVPTNTEKVDAGLALVPSSKRSMLRQSSVTLTGTIKKKGSMDSLIDSLRPGTPSPSKGKSKAVEVQPAASTSEMPSLLPDYLVPPPSKKETVDAASKRADANLALVDSKIDGVQAQLSEEVKGMRTHLAKLAGDISSKTAALPDHATHTTISHLITSHNKVVETVRDLNAHVASLISSTASVNTRLDSFEAALASMEPIRMPAEKRSRYEDIPISTLVTMPSSIQPELPHVGNFSPAYPNVECTGRVTEMN